MKPDGIILDIDGTLWNTTPVVARAWNNVLSKRPDVPADITAEKLQQLFGKLLSEIADALFPQLKKEDRYALIDQCCELEHQYLMETDPFKMLYPGVPDTIRELSNRCKIFIVSNCQSGYIELFLEKTGLGSCITDFECPGYTGLDKAGNIRLIVERNHLEHPVYVGDTDGDHKATRQAGIPFCYASYGFGQTEHPDYVIRQFSDLLSIF